jgi:hypothetical protein
MFIKQMREQLGEDDGFIVEEKENEIPIIKQETNEKTIELIDEMLRRPGLKPSEIDRLLDERAQLTKKPE